MGRPFGGIVIETLIGPFGGIVIETLIVNVLLVLMAFAVLVLARTRNLFAVVVLSGIYSFLMATILVALDAVDVAMTEAAVGAGVSTVLLLGALHLCKSEEARPAHRPWLPLLLSLATAGLLIYGAMGLPDFAHRRAGQLPRLRHPGRNRRRLHRRRRHHRLVAPAQT